MIINYKMNKIMIKYYKYLLLLFFVSAIISCDDTEKPYRLPSDEMQDIVLEPGMNLGGQVLLGGKPKEGVIVSDGFSVALTDANGIYQIARRDSSRFVFVSIPAESEVPMANGKPTFYYSIKSISLDKKIRRDFSLTAGTKKTQFELLALADVQIGQSKELSWLTLDEIPMIAEYATSIIKNKPVYGISVGDLVWDNMPYFENYSQQIKRLGLPVFSVIGNHDHNQSIIENDMESASNYEDNMGPTYYSYNIGDCHFVVLDDVLYQRKDKYEAEITPNQLTWLKKDLEHVSKDKLIILGTHIATKRRNRPSSSVTNNQALYDILSGYKVRIISGHSHNNYTTTINDNIEENTLGAVMGAFWNYYCNDGSPRGYAMYEINGNEITDWYYKGTDKKRDYQMLLYPPGTVTNPAKYANDIIINIFSWHTTWTVNIYEDDVLKKTYEANKVPYGNIFLEDPTAVKLFKGDKLPVHHPSAEPEAYNDHMFTYTPSASWTKVKVEAITPYNKKYTEEITK